MIKRRLKYVVEDTDRHGNVRLYYRRPGQPKIRLPGPVGSPEFWEAYRRAHAGDASGKTDRRKTPEPETFRWLVESYYRSPAFARLDAKTQAERRGILERLVAEHGGKPFRLLEPRHVRRWRNERSATPFAANNMVKVLRYLYQHAVEADLVERSPVRDVSLLKVHSEGFHEWTEAEIAAFEARHPIGTKARLALALLLYTGQRRSDVVLLGRQHVREGFLCFTQEKNRNRKPVRLEIPIVPELAEILGASPVGDLTFLVTEWGRPFTVGGFGNKFRRWCDEAGLRQCSAHGLRKAAARRLAEAGCTEHEIRSITGHQTSQEVDRYTRGADQRRLAARALSRVGTAKSVPPATAIAGGGTKSDRKSLENGDVYDEWHAQGESETPEESTG